MVGLLMPMLLPVLVKVLLLMVLRLLVGGYLLLHVLVGIGPTEPS
jgi:hypothetical protein